MSGFSRILTNLSNDASAQPSLIEELWAYFTEKYFTIDVSQYDNLNLELGGDGIINLSWAIIALCVGMVLAAILAVYEKKGLGEFVRKLISEECYTPESAKTLYELGFRKNAAVRGALRGGSLSKVVICTQKKAYEDQIEQAKANYEANATADSPKFKSVSYRIDFEKDTFYIPKDASYAADVRYDKKGSGVVAVLVVAGLSLVVAAFIIFILPDMLRMLDNFVGMIRPQANYH